VLVPAWTQRDDLRSRRVWALCQGRARAMFGEGGVMKFDERLVRRTELVMIVAVMMLVLVGYVISKL
jgi:hypothetical protein